MDGYMWRDDWRAKAPQGEAEPLKPRVEKVVVHFSTNAVNTVPACYSWSHCKEVMQELQAYSMKDLGLVDIPYNFLVGSDGEVYEGRGWEVSSDPSLPFPEYLGNRFDIAFIGDWTCEYLGTPAEEVPLLSDMKDKCSYLIAYGVEKKSISRDYELLLVKGNQLGTVFDVIEDQ